MDSLPHTPKRKRNNPTTLHPPPWTNPKSPSASPNSSEPNSPRSLVANRLSDLHLNAAIAEPQTSPTPGPALTKRPRFSFATDSVDESSSDDDGEPRTILIAPNANAPLTQTAHLATPSTSPPSIRQPSPPPPKTLTITKTSTRPTNTNIATTPSSTNTDTTTTDLPSDDDGRGLNGIGYRPTPAMAYLRAQKRKQQVLDWRAREAKEARQKRRERRVEGTEAFGGKGGGVGKVGRVVRFA